jgi:hypothetical protein
MDAKEEDRLVRKYMQLARCAAARTYRKWGERLDEGELVSEAMLILLEAIRGFDPEISSNGWETGFGPCSLPSVRVGAVKSGTRRSRIGA